MTLSDFATIGDLVSSAAVVATLIFLALQVKQANLLARSQARQRMVEHAQAELYVWMDNPDLRQSYLPTSKLSEEMQSKLHFFLTGAMRQREWEWFQFRDGVIKKDVYQAYHEVIALHLGIPRTRKWWATVGRIGFDPTFVAEVDSLLAAKPLVNYFADLRAFATE